MATSTTRVDSGAGRGCDRGGQSSPLAWGLGRFAFSAVKAVGAGGLKGPLRRPAAALDPASIVASGQHLGRLTRPVEDPDVRVLSAGGLKATAHGEE